MRTEVTTWKSMYMRLRIYIRVIIIVIVTIIFYAKLAIGADTLNTNKYSYSNIEDNERTGKWIGQQSGNTLVLKLDAIMITDFEILLDDALYSGSMEANEEKTIHAFNVSELQSKRFYVHEFWVNDKRIEGEFGNLTEWMDYLNENTFINWSIDMKRGLLICDKEKIIFSDFIVSSINDEGKMKSFSPVSGLVSKNVLIEIPEGSHKITIHNFITGCSETKVFFIEKEMALKIK